MSLSETFASLGEDEADLKRWINEALSEVPQGTTFMQHLSNVRSEVQQLATTWSNQMEEQGAACLPRVVRSLREIESLRTESDNLSESIAQLHDRVGNLELETSASVRTLSELEVIKRRMDSCSSVLLQADRFKIQLRSMDAVYESGNVQQMSAALSALVSSFSSLSTLSEFEGDKALIARYTERLESLVKPKMVESFEAHDTPQALACIATFRQIDRADQISLAYHKHVNQKVLALWHKFDLYSSVSSASSTTSSGSHPSGKSGAHDAHHTNHANLGVAGTTQSAKVTPTSSRASTPLPAITTTPNSPSTTPLPTHPIDTWISLFYEQLAPLLQAEIVWIPNVFSDPAPAIAKLLIATLTQLSTLFDHNLRKLDISRLADVYTRTKTFATSIDPFVTPLGAGLRFQVYQALFAPFRKYQTQFFALESKWLEEQLANFDSAVPTKTTPDAILDSLNTRSRAVFANLHTAIDHCSQFTEAAESESLHRLATMKITALLQLALKKVQLLQPLLVTSTGSSSAAAHSATTSSSALSAASSTIGDLSEWKEDLFLKAVNATKVAATLKNLLATFTAAYRSKMLAQKSILFGEQTLQQALEADVRTTSNLFLYQPIEEVKKLAQLLTSLEQADFDPFASCSELWSFLTSTTQFITFETMFGFIRHQMANFSKLPNFVRENGPTSPPAQSYIKQIVEHFLVLPQVMEAMESESEENEETSFLTLPIKPFGVLGRPKYFGLAPSLLSAPGSAEEASSGFSGVWMEIVAQETQLLLASHVLQLPHITAFGVDQLEADILHLFSVLSVLSLHQEVLLEQLLEYCRVPASDFAALLTETNDLERKKMLILLGRSRRVLPSSNAK